jgi:hypothetical protein
MGIFLPLGGFHRFYRKKDITESCAGVTCAAFLVCRDQLAAGSFSASRKMFNEGEFFPGSKNMQARRRLCKIAGFPEEFIWAIINEVSGN